MPFDERIYGLPVFVLPTLPVRAVRAVRAVVNRLPAPRRPRSKKRRQQAKWEKQTKQTIDSQSEIHCIFLKNRVYVSNALFDVMKTIDNPTDSQSKLLRELAAKIMGRVGTEIAACIVEESSQPEDPFHKIYNSRQLPNTQYMSAPKGTAWPPKSKLP